MNNFYPGDKVRFLDQDGDGVVLSIKNGTAIVQTADGFDFPYPESQLVKVETPSNKSEKVFKSSQADEVVLGKYGFYLAYVPKAGNLVTAIFINKTSFDVLYSLGEERFNGTFGLSSGRLPSGRFVELYSRNREEVEQWPHLVMHVIYHNDHVVLPDPATFRHRVLPKDFLQAKRQAPILGKEAYLFQLDGQEWQDERQQLKEKLKDAFQGKKVTELKDLDEALTMDVVDLHMEAIPNAPSDMGLKSILKFQVEYAEQMLDRAVAAGLSKITFIHGAGDGVLKREIQRLGKEHPHVSSYGKGDVQKYGGGATFLKLK